MPTSNSCRHRDKGDGSGAPPKWQWGHEARTLHLILNLQERMMKRRIKMEKKGK
jgi:hypothetical protein